MRLGLDYAFNELNLQKISLEVLELNTGALKLYEKLGFKKEGFFENHFYSNGVYFNVLVMSLSRDKEKKAMV